MVTSELALDLCALSADGLGLTDEECSFEFTLPSGALNYYKVLYKLGVTPL